MSGFLDDKAQTMLRADWRPVLANQIARARASAGLALRGTYEQQAKFEHDARLARLACIGWNALVRGNPFAWRDLRVPPGLWEPVPLPVTGAPGGESVSLDAVPLAPDAAEPAPLPMLLWCPACHARHIDDPARGAHKTHACQACGLLWRPALVATAGVEFLPGCRDVGGLDTQRGRP